MPEPESPPPKSDWHVGERVRVQRRPTTRTLLDALEKEWGTVMEVIDLETDQCIRVRFPVETWNRLPEDTQDRMAAVHEVLQRLSRPWPFVKLKTIGAEAWMFGGDLAE